MAERGVVGTLCKRASVSPAAQQRYLTAFKTGVGCLAGGFVFIYWQDFLDPASVALGFLPMILIPMILAIYHVPGVVYGVMDFVVGSGVGCLAAFVNFKILGFNEHSPYWNLPLAWAFVFLTAYLDKTGRHIMFLKLAVIFYMMIGVFYGIPTQKLMGTLIYYILVYGMMFAAGIAVFLSATFLPTFASQLILPQMIVTLQDCRDLYSLIAVFHVKKERKISEAQTEAYKSQINALVMQTHGSIELTKKYFKDAQMEFWNRPRLQQLQPLYLELTQMANVLAVMKVALKHEDSSRLAYESVKFHGLSELGNVNVELITWLDKLIDHARAVHRTDYCVPSIIPDLATGSWPSFERAEAARAKLVVEFRAEADQFIANYADQKNPLTPRHTVQFSSFIMSLGDFFNKCQKISALLQEIPKEPRFFAHRTVPKALFMTFYASSKMIFVDDFGLGIVAEIKKGSQPLKRRLTRYYHSKRWKFPARFATLITAVLVWAIYARQHEFTRSNTTNVAWLLNAVIMITLPSLGGTITRGLHRIVGTAAGALLAYAFARACMAAGDYNDPARWIVMQVLAFVIMGGGNLINTTYPATGYALVIGPLTVFLLYLSIFHQPGLDVPPKDPAIIRVVYTTMSVIYTCCLFPLLLPERSTSNLDRSIVDCITLSGKTFSAIIDCGLMKDSNPTCQFTDEEKKEITTALSALQTSLDMQQMLLVDAFYEARFLRRKNYSLYEKACFELKRLQHRLSALYSVFSNGYGAEVTQEYVAPIRNPIKNLTRPISARVADITALRAMFPEGKKMKLKKLRRLTAAVRSQKYRDNLRKSLGLVQMTQPIHIGAQLMEELLEEMDTNRQKLWEKKIYLKGDARMEMFRFYGLIYAMEEFVQIWESTIQLVATMNIRKELGADALMKSDEEYLRETTLRLYEGAGKTLETPKMSASSLDQFIGTPAVIEPEEDEEDEIQETVGLKETELENISPERAREMEIEELRQATEVHDENEIEIVRQQNKGGYFE
eukprot:Phypoly_transcript_01821.p1 GENE.Phypoly_transcript_01821~~Phypoly_transcript_01821.p1  ORF type:complete len:1039 (+),score=122.52 Phypoly_transcript_01821:96-3119(+)